MAEQTMVERVAKALRPHLPELSDAGNLARVAIEAMREPTAEMVGAGEDTCWAKDYDRLVDAEVKRHTPSAVRSEPFHPWPPSFHYWQTMIDAALKEQANG